jgi:peptide/nickel transport system ATP-binding protein
MNAVEPPSAFETPLLTLRDLSIGRPDGSLVVHSVSLTVPSRRFTAVVGESGSGKTMIARAILGLLPHPLKRISGSIIFEGADLAEFAPEALRKVRGGRIGMVFQEPMVSLNPAMRIGLQLIEAVCLHRGLSRDDALAEAARMLRRIGIDDVERCLKAHPHEFSGGMRQRIMLASVMLTKPALLIADEPTTALDTLTQKDVLDLMQELTREAGTAVLLISHDLALVSRYADQIAVMQEGKVVEAGAARAVVANPRDGYTHRLLEALPSRSPSRPPADETQPLVSIRNLSVAYPGKRRLFGRWPDRSVIDGLSLDIHAGETLALVGGSGSGKTTLGRALLGLAPRRADALTFDGIDLLTARTDEFSRFRRDCQLIYQDPYSSLDPRMRVIDIVAEPLRLERTIPSGERRARSQVLLDRVGLKSFGDRFPHALSGGQRQRVAIARALIRRPKLVVADEPVSALDVTVQKQVLMLLAELKADFGFTALFISHDLAVVDELADRIAVMQAGRIVELGRKEDVIDQPQHPYSRRLVEASFGLQMQRDQGGTESAPIIRSPAPQATSGRRIT